MRQSDTLKALRANWWIVLILTVLALMCLLPILHTVAISFSDQAKRELASITAAMTEIITITVDSFDRSDLELAARVEPLEQVIDGLIATANARHVERLKKGKCTIELGFILADVLNNCQRASDHCSNIAVCLIQTKRDAFETHSYLNKLKTSGSQAFKDAYYYYAAQYVMPEE